MSSGVEHHVLARIEAAEVQSEPFPHCVVDGIFPEDFYEEIVDRWPERDRFVPISETGRASGATYAKRLVIPFEERELERLDPEQRTFWSQTVGSWLLHERFGRALLAKFHDALAERLAREGGAFRADALLVSDQTSYAIGPHTDTPKRLVSLLFYLPEDATFKRFGTSFYVPKDRRFRCAGGPHYDPRSFQLVRTVEFLPNRLVLFPKTDRSFHGVEPVDLPGIDRRLLIYNARNPES
jgi:hypothetical protein